MIDPFGKQKEPENVRSLVEANKDKFDQKHNDCSNEIDRIGSSFNMFSDYLYTTCRLVFIQRHIHFLDNEQKKRREDFFQDNDEQIFETDVNKIFRSSIAMDNI